ncbi:MAG: hypothetical protein WAO83_21165 [Fuerstiella sp.]
MNGQTPIAIRRVGAAHQNPACRKRWPLVGDAHPTHLAARLLVLALVMVAFCSSPANAQTSAAASPQASPDWHFSFELFQMLLEEGGLQPVKDFRELGNNPRDCVIVAFGRLNGVTYRNVQQFTERGGAMLLATDRDFSFRNICDFRAGPVIAELSSERYQDHQDCPLITDLTQDNPLVEGVRSLVANKSGWIDKPSWPTKTWDVAARLPADSLPTSSKRKTLLAEIPMPGDPTGLLLVCADQSLFTNGMLWHGDNAVLAINVSKALSSGRRRLLFMVNGRPMGSFKDSPEMQAASQPPKLPDNLPPITKETILPIANAVLQNVQQADVINSFLANRPRNMKESHYRRAMLFALAALALAFVIWKLSGNGPPLSHPMPTRRMLTAHALSSEHKANAAEFGISASMLARELCRELTGSTDTHVWIAQLSPDRLQQTSAVEKTLNENNLKSILELAVKTGTLHLPQKKFLSIGNTINQLRQLHYNQQLLKPSSQT